MATVSPRTQGAGNRPAGRGQREHCTPALSMAAAWKSSYVAGSPAVLTGKTSLRGAPLSLGWVSSHHLSLKYFRKTSGELWTPYCPSAFIPHLTQVPEAGCFCTEARPEAHSRRLPSTLLQVGSKLFLAGGVSVTPSRAPKQNLRQNHF